MLNQVVSKALTRPEECQTVSRRCLMKAALYARVSTLDQEPENQLAELRRYAAARGWEISEYVDHGVSGSQDRRKALDALVQDDSRELEEEFRKNI